MIFQSNYNEVDDIKEMWKEGAYAIQISFTEFYNQIQFLKNNLI